MTERNQPSRLAKARLEAADDRLRSGVLTAAAHKKITLRHLGDRGGAVPDRIDAPGVSGAGSGAGVCWHGS